jgi:bacteriorhodopsin
MFQINIYTSLLASIIIQLITGIIEVISLFIKVPSQFFLLKQMVMLEVFVQFIEGSFYFHWFHNFKQITNVTPRRYMDWVITTPLMLVNLILYLLFLEQKQNNHTNDNNNATLDFVGLVNQEFYTIITVLLLNWVMLLCGFLAEISVIPLFLGVFLGFIPFMLYYYIIYTKYAVTSSDGFNLFLYFFIFWSLYGVLAVLPYNIKNICYNFLDLFSKNFFGIFLSYLIIKNKV